MEYQGKEKSPYYGVVQSSILLAFAPIFSYFLFYLILYKFFPRGDLEMRYACVALGGLIASLFQLSCALAGLFKGIFKVVVNRVKELLENLSISFKFAMKYYWENVKSEGIVFWIYFNIILLTIISSIWGFVKYFELVY